MALTVKKVVGKTQSDGAFTVELGSGDWASRHQIQVELSKTPSSGSLKVEIRSPRATKFMELGNSPIDLTSSDLIKVISGYAFVSEFRFTPSSLDTGVTYNVIVTSGS